MTTYAHTTLAQLRSRLASALGDPSMVFFLSGELDLYIAEALRWWGLSAMYFRETASFETVAGQAFYDLPTELVDGDGAAVQDFTLTDRDLITDCTYALMEPEITDWASGWVGTEMFSLNEISETLQLSRDEILKMSGLLTYEEEIPIVVVNQSRVDLSDETVQVVRASIEPVSDDIYPLFCTDNIQDQTTVRATYWPEPSRPKSFSVNYTPQLSLDLWPPPSNPGTLRVYIVRSGATFSPTSSATAIGLPDDACWLVKYRALEDLLAGDGLSRAWKMAQYCHERVEAGLDALENYLSITWADVNGRRVPIAPLASLDMTRPKWQVNEDAPRKMYQLSWNQVALYPVPDNEYVVTVEAVKKAPIPTADGDYIQVGQESLQAILDYAQHIASFKMQGAEFEMTVARYQSAKEQADDYRAQVIAQSYIGGRALAWTRKQDRWSRAYRKRTFAEEVAQEVALG